MCNVFLNAKSTSLMLFWSFLEPAKHIWSCLQVCAFGPCLSLCTCFCFINLDEALSNLTEIRDLLSQPQRSISTRRSTRVALCTQMYWFSYTFASFLTLKARGAAIAGKFFKKGTTLNLVHSPQKTNDTLYFFQIKKKKGGSGRSPDRILCLI